MVRDSADVFPVCHISCCGLWRDWCGKLPTDNGCRLLFSGQIAFATKMSLVRDEVQRPPRWLENIIISQLWDANCSWLLVIHSIAVARNLSLYYLLCSRRTRCHPCGKICFAHSLSSGPQLQLWSSAGAADGSKVLQPEPRPVQMPGYLSDGEMICYANHYSYLTTCGVATLVLMAPHTGRLLLMLTATPSE